MGSPAGGERCAVTGHEIDRLGMNPELIRHDLPEARLVALPARLRSDDEGDAACGRYFNRDPLVWHAHRSLDVIGDADPEQPAALLGLPTAGGKAVPVRGLQRAREVTGEISAVVSEPGRRAAGQRVAPDQISAAQVHTVDLQPFRRAVHEPLPDSRGFSLASAKARRRLTRGGR